MSEIFIEDKQSVLIVEEDNGRFDSKLLLSKDDNDNIDKSALLLAAIALRLNIDEDFADDCIKWFNNYVSDNYESKMYLN